MQPHASPSPLQIRQAFVLGAGLGTRLKRLTQARPKPLVPIANELLITAAFEHLYREAGVERIIVNTHHLAGHYDRFFPKGTFTPKENRSSPEASAPAIPLLFRHEPKLLETGGGIKNIEDLLEGTSDDASFILYNGDVFSTLPLAPAIEEHLATDNEVTLVLRSHGGPTHIAFQPIDTRGNAPTGRVADIRGLHQDTPGTHLFTGIYLLRSRFLQRLKREKASIIPTFLEMMEQNIPAGAVVIDDGVWWDLGTREQYLTAHQSLAAASHTGDEKSGYGSHGAPWVHPTAQISPSACLTGATAIGAGCIVHDGAQLHDTILWEEVEIAPKSALTRCIVTDRLHIAGSHADSDF